MARLGVPRKVGFHMDERQLLERYEALGDEHDYLAAKPLFERALAERSDTDLLLQYGYLLECHGRNELRQAVGKYEQAIELNPQADKPVYQLISAYTGLREPERAVALSEARLAAAPGDLREHRFLASAYLLACDYEKAKAIIEAGLVLAADDAKLIADRGELKAATGDPDGALADWANALELDPNDIGALYSSAFLLEREGRIANAIEAWESIFDSAEVRGNTHDTDWPKRELERLTEAQ
jgi:tetratricopeptide (TPR) repeat protein